MARRTLMSWSSGKDSAWALYQLQQNPDYDLAGLFTTTNQEFERVAMHAVRQELLQLQAAAIGLPLEIIPLPFPCDNQQYSEIMQAFIKRCLADEIEVIAFGDLFLEDIRDYRLQQMKDTGIEAVFPIWGEPTDELARRMIDSGMKAILTCVDPQQLSPDFLGRDFDESLLNELPSSADPCGENGEFHSFVYDGPMFNEALDIRKGELLERDGFHFADVLPV